MSLETGDTLFHGILIDITERKELERRLREQSVRDPLTGCFNRRFLPELEKRVQTGSGGWGVAVADIDHFKQYNDRHGHKAGDEVLVETAAFLRSLLRQEDAVVRTGGDELLLVVWGRESRSTRRALRRIEREITARSPVPLTVASSVRNGDEPLEQTIIRADLELLEIRNRARRSSGTDSGPE